MLRSAPFLLALLAPLAPLAAQEATYVTFGAGCPGTGTGLGPHHIAPQQFATAFMPSNNVYGFSGSSQKYQQVFLASEFPTAFTMNGLALRWDNQTFQQIYGATVDLEIAIGFTTRTPATLGATFAANFDLGPPVTVLPRTLVDYPDYMPPPPADPSVFQVVIPFAGTFAWVPQPGRNLLLQVILRGNSQGPGWVYVFDCGWSPSIARLFAGSENATTGTLDGYAYGYAIDFRELTNTAVPTLTAADMPQYGNQVPIDLAQAHGASFAMLVTGLSRTSFGPYALPFPLAAHGAPGCSLLASGDTWQLVTTNAAGRGRGFFDVPNQFSLAGLHFYNQFLVWDPAANALGFALSNGGNGAIGN